MHGVQWNSTPNDSSRSCTRVAVADGDDGDSGDDSISSSRRCSASTHGHHSVGFGPQHQMLHQLSHTYIRGNNENTEQTYPYKLICSSLRHSVHNQHCTRKRCCICVCYDADAGTFLFYFVVDVVVVFLREEARAPYAIRSRKGHDFVHSIFHHYRCL